MVDREMAGPQEHVKKYDKYSDLVTKKADADVERFLLEGHDFDRFAVVGFVLDAFVRDFEWRRRPHS